MPEYTECPICGAAVIDSPKHLNWHGRIEDVVDMERDDRRATFEAGGLPPLGR